MRVQPRRQRHHAFAVLGIFTEYDADDFGLALVDFQISLASLVFHEFIAEGSLTSVPLAIAGLLFTSRHRLRKDVVALHLGE